MAAGTLAPPIETSAECLSGNGDCVAIDESGIAQVKHDLGHAAGKKDLHGGEIARAIGERIDETRHLTIYFGPIRCGGTLQARGMGNGGDMQQEVGGTAERGMKHHRIANRRFCQDLFGADPQPVQAQNGAARAAGYVKPDGLA